MATVVAVPTIVLTFVYGSIVDTHGVRRSSVSFAVTCATGAVLLGMAVSFENVGLLGFARTLVGIGVYSLRTVQSVYLKVRSTASLELQFSAVVSV